MEGSSTARRSTAPLRMAAAQHPLHDQIGPMQRAPEDERPARAVPESAEEHGDHQVAVRAPSSAAIAAQRDIEVITQPTGERDVPARPEFAEAAREVRAVEVDAEVESENARQSDGDARIAGEIAVDLERVEVDADEQRP